MQPSPHDVPALVDRWVAAGIITDDQAQRIRADLATLAPRRASFVAEGLGYLGGVIVLVGLGLVLGLSWEKLSAAGRVGVAAGSTVALAAAGALIPAQRLGSAGPRLRGVLWALASAGTFASVGLFADEILHWKPDRLIVLASAVTVVVSACLWALNRHVLQHLATLAPLLVAAYWVTYQALPRDEFDDPGSLWYLPGLAIWFVSVVWYVLSLSDTVPRRAGGVFGAIGAIIGVVYLSGEKWGPALGLATVLALVVVAVLRRDLPVLGVGSVGTLIVLPMAVDRYLGGGTLTTALALVIAGLALVATGVYTARRRPSPAPAPPATS